MPFYCLLIIPYLPKRENKIPEGAEDAAAPIKKENIVTGANELLLPIETADKGPISCANIIVSNKPWHYAHIKTTVLQEYFSPSRE